MNSHKVGKGVWVYSAYLDDDCPKVTSVLFCAFLGSKTVFTDLYLDTTNHTSGRGRFYLCHRFGPLRTQLESKGASEDGIR